METGAESSAGGAAAAAQSGAHIGMNLFTQAVKAADAAAKTAGGAAKTAASAASDLGEGPFAKAIKAGRRPPDSLVQFLDELHEFHAGMASDIDQAINTSQNYYRPQFAEALQGQAGDALLGAHDKNIKLWDSHQDQHTSASTAAWQASRHTQTLQGRIDNIAEAGQEAFDHAVKSRNPAAAMQVWTTYSTQADEAVAESAGKVTQALDAKFTIPQNGPGGQKPLDSKDGKRADADKSDKKADAKRTDGKGSDAKGLGDKDTDSSRTVGAGDSDPSKATVSPAAAQTTTPGTNPDAGRSEDLATRSSQLPMTAMPSSGGRGGGGSGSGSGGGGGMGSGMGSMSGLGSSMKPPSGLGSPGSGGMPGGGGMPSGAGMPGGGASTSPASASPLGNAGSSFQSGLASGMSATGGGGAPAPVSPVSQPLSQQQAAAAYAAPPAGPVAGSSPAAVPMGGVPSGGDLGGSSAAQSGSGGGPMGGGGMMPPAGGMAGGPMSPYSAPGAGAGGAAPAAPSAGTSPASAGGAGGGVGSPGGAAGSGPGPMMAAGPGSGAAMGGLGATSAEINPDLLLAQRVIGGLVRGCENWPSLIAWAVSVVNTPVGSQIIIASSAGGGGYVPPTVVLPLTARLAVCDPALPFGWAARWMGCQKPSKILADHFELFRKKTAGAQLSALVTTELWAQAPEGVRDFQALQHRDALAIVSEAPRLDGGHQHRLSALDPGLAHRVANIDKGADVSAWAAANLTAAVFNAAVADPDATGEKLVTNDEIAVLQSVHRGTADEMTWQVYDTLADKRHGGALVWPEVHAPQDSDGSDLTEAMTLWYRHFFRMGRIVELVRCWKVSPPPLADVVYCAVQAGFGATVVPMIGAMEQQIRGQAS